MSSCAADGRQFGNTRMQLNKVKFYIYRTGRCHRLIHARMVTTQRSMNGCVTFQHTTDAHLDKRDMTGACAPAGGPCNAAKAAAAQQIITKTAAGNGTPARNADPIAASDLPQKSCTCVRLYVAPSTQTAEQRLARLQRCANYHHSSANYVGIYGPQQAGGWTCNARQPRWFQCVHAATNPRLASCYIYQGLQFCV